jgi:hypothetical protein
MSAAFYLHMRRHQRVYSTYGALVFCNFCALTYRDGVDGLRLYRNSVSRGTQVQWEWQNSELDAATAGCRRNMMENWLESFLAPLTLLSNIVIPHIIVRLDK